MTSQAPRAARGLILALDLGAGGPGVALGTGLPGAACVQRRSVQARTEADRVLLMIEACLEEAGQRRGDIGLIACTHGPGAFTAVRIALSVAQGLALALDVPACGVCSLDVLAQTAWRRHGWERVLAALDARMGEVYWRALALDAESGLMRPLGPPQLCAPAAVVLTDTDPAGWRAAGSGWALIEAAAPGTVPSGDASLESEPCDLLAFAAAAWQAAAVVEAAALEPLYLRDKVTHGNA
jgi:tRNA threonylcarbamoyladenosine biosynthesis protein TsaB